MVIECWMDFHVTVINSYTYTHQSSSPYSFSILQRIAGSLRSGLRSCGEGSVHGLLCNIDSYRQFSTDFIVQVMRLVLQLILVML
jgi:hypothetical protein